MTDEELQEMSHEEAAMALIDKAMTIYFGRKTKRPPVQPIPPKLVNSCRCPQQVADATSAFLLQLKLHPYDFMSGNVNVFKVMEAYLMDPKRRLDINRILRGWQPKGFSN